jgi:hypothetical protein
MSKASEVRVWNEAIHILDRSEIFVRDSIEREMAPYAALQHVKYKDAMSAVDRTMAKVERIRTAAFKKAFRHIRQHSDGL